MSVNNHMHDSPETDVMTSSCFSEHAQKQKQLEAEIAERILKEEQLMKRKKVLYPNLFSTAESEKKKVGNHNSTTHC